MSRCCRCRRCFCRHRRGIWLIYQTHTIPPFRLLLRPFLLVLFFHLPDQLLFNQSLVRAAKALFCLLPGFSSQLALSPRSLDLPTTRKDEIPQHRRSAGCSWRSCCPCPDADRPSDMRGKSGRPRRSMEIRIPRLTRSIATTQLGSRSAVQM
jgi:hypothetical protein